MNLHHWIESHDRLSVEEQNSCLNLEKPNHKRIELSIYSVTPFQTKTTIPPATLSPPVVRSIKKSSPIENLSGKLKTHQSGPFFFSSIGGAANNNTDKLHERAVSIAERYGFCSQISNIELMAKRLLVSSTEQIGNHRNTCGNLFS